MILQFPISFTHAKAAPPDITAQSILHAFKTKNASRLSSYVDEGQGLRFLPYPWDEIPVTVVMKPKEVQKIFTSRAKKRWGAYDGSGDPINLTPLQYFKQFIWNVDYTKIPNRESLSLAEHLRRHYGNRGSNEDVLQAFPDGWAYTIFYPGVTGPEGGAMDWSWLTLILVPKGEGWALAGIVHNQWTI